jgi:hypothetical protein
MTGQPNPTIREALARIAEIERQITEAIEAFETQSGAEVVAVTLHKTASGDPRRQRTYRAQVEVRL